MQHLKESVGHITKHCQNLIPLSLTESEWRSGTFSRRASYIFLFWKADLRTIRRKVDLSIAHRVPPAVTAFKLGSINLSEMLLRIFLNHHLKLLSTKSRCIDLHVKRPVLWQREACCTLAPAPRSCRARRRRRPACRPRKCCISH